LKAKIATSKDKIIIIIRYYEIGTLDHDGWDVIFVTMGVSQPP